MEGSGATERLCVCVGWWWLRYQIEHLKRRWGEMEGIAFPCLCEMVSGLAAIVDNRKFGAA